MSKYLEALNCPNCGAPINRATMKCEYCGTVFREDKNRNMIVVGNPYAIPIQAEFRMPWEAIHMIGRDETGRIIRNELINSMKPYLEECMDIVCEEDPQTMSYRCAGRIRVFPKDFRF